jgi:hypothetical protein
LGVGTSGGGGYKKRVKEAESRGNIMYSRVKMEKNETF